ncbi:MAG: oligosaccharide flippase family protein [Candidatus Eisenbacteria bacterium]
MRRLRELLLSRGSRDYVLTTGTRFGVLGLTLLSNIVITRTVGAEGRGLYALVNNTILLGALVAGLGSDEAVAYFVARDKDLRSRTVGNALLIGLSGALVLTLLGVVFRGALPGVLRGLPSTAIMIAALALMPTVAARIFRTNLQGVRDFKSYNISLAARPALILIYCSGGLLMLQLGQRGIPIILLLVAVSELAVSGSLARRHVRPRLRTSVERMKSLMSYGLRAQANVILQFVSIRAGIFLLGYFRSPEDVGVYSVAAALAEIQLYLPSAVGWVWMPKVASQPFKHSVDGTRQLIIKVLPMLFLTAVLLALAGSWLLPAAFGTKFADSYVPMLILLPGCTLLGLATIMFRFFAGIGKPHLTTFVSLGGLAAIAVTQVLLIPAWGANGAAAGSCLGYVCVFAAAAVVFMKTSRNVRTRD